MDNSILLLIGAGTLILANHNQSTIPSPSQTGNQAILYTTGQTTDTSSLQATANAVRNAGWTNLDAFNLLVSDYNKALQPTLILNSTLPAPNTTPTELNTESEVVDKDPETKTLCVKGLT